MITTLPDADQLSSAVAERFSAVAREAVQARGRFNVVLAGGNTPRRTYERLAAPPYRDEVPWNRTRVFWGDERCVADTDPRSNYRMARVALLDHVPIPPHQIHAMTGSLPPEHAARAYQALLEQAFAGSREPHFDLVLLGLGEDGHTASLFPGAAVLQEEERWVAATGPAPDGLRRLTLTLPALNAARLVVFLVAGSGKARALWQVLTGAGDPSRWPAQRVQPPRGRVEWFVDAAAAELLDGPR